MELKIRKKILSHKEDILSIVDDNNTIQDYLIAVGRLLGGIVVLAIFKKLILSRLKKWSEKTETHI